MRFSNEIKAGLVVVIGIAIIFFFFGKTATHMTKTYDLKTFFGYAGNLKADAIVKLAGIEVGRVKKINFIYDPETLVECLLEINTDAKVRKDSLAYIATAGFVGDAYVGITAGEQDEFLVPGTTVGSEDPIEMRLLMKKAEDIANNLDNILAQIRGVVADNRQNLDNIVINLEQTTENFKEFSSDVQKHPWKLLFKPKDQ